jgi:hypothetical protein
MVYTAVPPDYCDNAVPVIVQQAPAGVNSLEKERLDYGEGKIDLYFQDIRLLSCHDRLTPSLS